MPVMVSVSEALLTQGDPLTVAYRSSGSDGTVAIVPSGSDPGSAVLTEDASGTSGSFEVDTAELEPGGYDAVLSGGDGAELARVGLWVRDPDAVIEVSTDRPSYRGGGADRRELDRRPGQPLGLDRGLSRRRRPTRRSTPT